MMNLTDFIFRKMLFQPVKLAAGHRFHFEEPFEELWFDTPDGQRLNVLMFPASARPKRGVILYFHGNRDNLQRWGAMNKVFTEAAYDFVVPDYRGYGKSSGTPDEQCLFEDAELLYDWLLNHYDEDQIVLYGRSLGTGMACHLAARVQARALILETPFDNFKGMIASHLRNITQKIESTLRFPNNEYLQKATMPVLIFHGTRDRVVPYASAANLKSCLKPGDKFVTIEGGSHNNLASFDLYQMHLKEWLEKG